MFAMFANSQFFSQKPVDNQRKWIMNRVKPRINRIEPFLAPLQKH